MSMFYCEHHQKTEDSDVVGFETVLSGDGSVVELCQEGYDELWFDNTTESEIMDEQKRIITEKFGEEIAKSANYGWVTGDDSVTTKVYTNPVRILTTEKTNGGFSHTWSKY